jgi:two-component system, chemotaxis family, chemotaxis protein CheY
MRILIVEDDYTSRVVLLRLLLPYGETQVALTGREAVDAFSAAITAGAPFDLVCLDIMLPGMDGQAVLREIRALESAADSPARKPARIIMTTALNDRTNVVAAIKSCDGYLVKPVDRAKLFACLTGFGFASQAAVKPAAVKPAPAKP